MTAAGAILDLHLGMKTATCKVYEFSGGNPEVPAQQAVGNFAADADKFPLHVLVVDDEPLIRWSVAESLSGLGMDVEQAGDATSALRKVTTAAVPFDVVFLDLRLPDMDDLSLLGTVRQLLPRAKVVLMTAFGTPDVITEAAFLGAEVLNKPFELADVNRLAQAAGQRPA
jgi:DNA-binding NtrC family response regulator